MKSLLQIQILGIDIESDFITKDNIDRIWKYVNSVNITVAKIFYLYFILDMTFKEIAEMLEMNESTVKSNLYRLLKNIKESFLGGVNINDER